MREIKFRVKEIKNGIPFSQWSYFTIGDLACSNFSANHKEFLGNTWSQYTGLKDKNGKEIYEGDIVRGQHQFHGEKQKHIVTRVVEYEAPHHGIAGFHIWPINFDQFPIEVIDNIWETPELREVKG